MFVSALERPGRSAAWLEEKRSQEGKWRCLRNYPLTAEEAFANASEPYFAAELVEAAQRGALPPSPARQGDRYLKAWDIGRKDASVCVVLRAPPPDEAQVLHVVGYQRLLGEDFPAIQRAIEAMHRRYPGPTVIEANSIGKPVIQNLQLPASELIELTTTAASKQAMLTALEIRLQERMLKIDPGFQQLLNELRDYPTSARSTTDDSLMALGFAVVHADHAHAVKPGGRINRRLFLSLNDLCGRLDEREAPPKLTMRGPNDIIYTNIDPEDREIKLCLGYEDVVTPADALK